MDTEKENVVKVEDNTTTNIDKKEENKEENKGLFNIPVLIGVILYLVVAVVISYAVGIQMSPENEGKQETEQKEPVKDNKEDKDDKKEPVKPVEKEEIKLTIDETKGAEFLENFNYVLHNVYTDSTGHLIPDDKRNSDDLFKDEITKFKFIYYLLERYGDKENKKYNTNINGLYEVGAYSIKYNYFIDYYKQITGVDFNDQVIYKVGAPYKINGEYLYGRVVNELNENYKLSNESFVQIGDKYYFTVLIEEMDATKNVVLSYRVKLCISIVNDEFMLNSIIVY